MFNRYKAISKKLTLTELNFAIMDIKKSLFNFRDFNNDYTKKLNTEFDVYTQEYQKRINRS